MLTPPLSPLMMSQASAHLPEPAPHPVGHAKSSSVVQRLVTWVTLLVTGAAFYPLLSQHGLALWHSSEYQHAPLLFAAVMLLIWTRWPDRDDTRLKAVPRPLGLLVGLIGLLAAVVLNSPPVAMLAFVPAVFSALRCVSRTADFRRFLGPCLLLLLFVPLPYFVQMEVVQALKTWTTLAAGWILDLLGIDHQLLGFTLAVPGKWFFVDDACSGVNSLFGMVALALVLAVWSRLSVTLTLSMVPAATIAVLCVNVLRMVIIVTAYSWRGMELASGTPHQMLGLALLPLSLLMVVGLVSWTQWLLAPIGGFGDSALTELWDRVLHGGQLADDDHELESMSSTESLMVAVEPDDAPLAGRTIWGWLPLACLAGAAVYGQQRLQAINAASAISARPMALLDEQTLPESLFDWKRTAFRELTRKQQDPQGQHSLIWRYQHTQMDRMLTLSVDYPFPGWHDLTACYRASGWTVQDRKVTGGQGKPYVVRVSMKDGTGATGWLWFALVDVSGKTLEPPQKNWSATLMNQLRIAVNQFGTDTSTRQVQLIVPGGRELRPDEILQLELKFRELIPKLAPKLIDDGSGKQPRNGRPS